MKILNAAQIKAWDAYTIENEPIDSYRLMRRAADAFIDWFAASWPPQCVAVFCGGGGNGGDGLVIAAGLGLMGYEVHVYLCAPSDSTSGDFNKALADFQRLHPASYVHLTSGAPFPSLPPGVLIIDALFGSGLNRAATGWLASLIDYLNQSGHAIISVDLPSGIFADRHTESASIHAQHTFTFEIPKLGLLLPENAGRVGDFTIGAIGLHPDYFEQVEAKNIFMTVQWIRGKLKKRGKFDHKGTYGHALLICGSAGKAGAAILAAKACLRSGPGLLTVHSAASSRLALQIAAPEAMFSADREEGVVSEILDVKPYRAIGVGCGLGKAEATKEALLQLMRAYKNPMVIDADALNLIAENPELWALVPKQSILTPHPKEFERLFGKAADDFARLELLSAQATERGVYILLKGAHTVVATPEGVCYFNSTGNPGMAKGGSGDVLTGIITGLLARGYSPADAALIGVFEHGAAGDRAARRRGQEAMTAGDLIEELRFT